MRYFFSCEGAQHFHDSDGTELEGDHSALIQAVLNAGEVLTDHADAFAETRFWRMTVTDEQGRVAFRLNFNVER
jgi:hypothetical protein